MCLNEFYAAASSRHYYSILAIMALILLSSCRRRGQETVDYDRQLAPGEQALVEVSPTELPRINLNHSQRQSLQQGIKRSLAYLATPTAERKYPIAGVTRQQVIQGLKQLDQLLTAQASNQEIQQSLERDFRVLRSVGYDGRGSVLFTGYYTPIFEARRQPNATYRFPVYRRPASLVTEPGRTDAAWIKQRGGQPFPSRAEIEQTVHIADQRWSIYPAPLMLISFMFRDLPNYVSLTAHSLISALTERTGNPTHHCDKCYLMINISPVNAQAYPAIRELYRQQPYLVEDYMRRNPRFIFFTETTGGPFGSIGQEVTTNISIATDKDIFPPGALCLTHCHIGHDRQATVALRLDQDTGGAIKAPGRCDLYMGVGDAAEQQAGIQLSSGALYYLVAR